MRHRLRAARSPTLYGARASDVRVFCAGRTKTGLLRVDHAGVEREAHLDGRWLIRTSDQTTARHGCACRCRPSYAIVCGLRAEREHASVSPARAGALSVTSAPGDGPPSLGCLRAMILRHAAEARRRHRGAGQTGGP